MRKVIVSTLLLLLFLPGAYAVSFQKTLFSEMTGVVSFNGKPAANVRLLRKIKHQEFDETVTDEKGVFHFSAAYQKRTFFDFLATEFVVKQDIIAFREGKEYAMWNGVKRVPDNNAESRGKALVVTCELTDDDKFIMVDAGIYMGSCTWDVEPDEAPDMSNPFDSSVGESLK